MTTSVTVKVNGQYRATVTQGDRGPVVVEGDYNGGSGQKTFYVQHNTDEVFKISEKFVPDEDKRDKDDTRPYPAA